MLRSRRSRRGLGLNRAVPPAVSEVLEPRRLLSGASWTQVAKLLASDGTSLDLFGANVALSGDTAIVGSPGADSRGQSSGSAYVFNTETRQQTAQLNPDDAAAFDGFGISVALSGNTALVGSYGDDDNGSDSGSAYLFDAIAGTQIAKFKPADGEAGDQFGWSVAINGRIALVGSYLDDDNGLDSGSAYLFDVSTGMQIAKLKPSDGAEGDEFGGSVALFGDIALIGSRRDDDNGSNSGSAYVFSITSGVQIAKIKPLDGMVADNFGISVAIDGNIALIGAWLDDDNGNESGSAYLFDITNGTQIAKLKPSDGAAADNFGVSVALSCNTALVGSYRDDDNGSNSGSVYRFDATTGEQVSKLLPADGAAGDSFGVSVALAGGVALVGSYLDDDNGSNSGSVYLFRGTAPRVQTTAFEFEFSQQALVDFTQDIGASLDDGDVAVTHRTSGTLLPESEFVAFFDSTNNRLTVRFPGTLADGDYELRISADRLQNATGSTLECDVVLDFYILAGDANRDRRVNFEDLLIVAQNFAQVGRTFSQGNFDYSVGGLVLFSDLLILAQNYNATVMVTLTQESTIHRRTMRLIRLLS